MSWPEVSLHIDPPAGLNALIARANPVPVRSNWDIYSYELRRVPAEVRELLRTHCCHGDDVDAAWAVWCQLRLGFHPPACWW